MGHQLFLSSNGFVSDKVSKGVISLLLHLLSNSDNLRSETIPHFEELSNNAELTTVRLTR